MLGLAGPPALMTFLPTEKDFDDDGRLAGLPSATTPLSEVFELKSDLKKVETVFRPPDELGALDLFLRVTTSDCEASLMGLLEMIGRDVLLVDMDTESPDTSTRARWSALAGRAELLRMTLISRSSVCDNLTTKSDIYG